MNTQKPSTMTKGEIRTLAIMVTQHLLDYAPDLLSERVANVHEGYTPAKFDLQDTIFEALLENHPEAPEPS